MRSESKPRRGRRGGQERTVTRTEQAELPGEYIDGYNCHRVGAKKLLVALRNSPEAAPIPLEGRVQAAPVASLCPKVATLPLMTSL